MSTLRTNTLETLDELFSIDVEDISSAVGLSEVTDKSKGAALVGRATRHFFSVSDLAGVLGRYDGDTANLLSFWPNPFADTDPFFMSGANSGGSLIAWHATMPRTNHDGGMIISPTVPAPANVLSLQNYYDGVGDTAPGELGCWVRCPVDGVVFVTYYGALPNGVDMTPAFNAATQARKEYGDPLNPIDNNTTIKRVVGVPSSGSAYRIEGTVYIRKGQHLRGLGDGPCRIFVPVVSSTAPTFKLGYGIPGGVETVDNGGLPPSISNLCTEGGHTLGAIVEATGVAGVSMYNMFITTASLGFKGAGGDLVLTSCTFDDCARGVEMTGSRNILSDCHFFHPTGNAVLVGTGSYDWLIRDCTFAFCEQQDILIQGDANTVRGLSIVDCNFIENGQYATKTGHIALNMSGAEVMVNDCNFSNSKSWGIISLGTNTNEVTVKGCHFTGLKSNALYIQSSTARGIRVGGGKWTIQDCDFGFMFDTPISVNGLNATDRVVVKGNSWANNTFAGALVTIGSLVPGSRLLLEENTGDDVMPLIQSGNFNAVRVGKNSRWLGAPVTAGGRIAYTIPTFASFEGIVKIKANPLPGGSTLYRKSAVFAVSRGTDNISAAIRDYVEFTSLHNPAVGTAGALAVQWDINALGGGANITPTAIGRNVIVSVPDTYTNFEVEIS